LRRTKRQRCLVSAAHMTLALAVQVLSTALSTCHLISSVLAQLDLVVSLFPSPQRRQRLHSVCRALLPTRPNSFSLLPRLQCVLPSIWTQLQDRNTDVVLRPSWMFCLLYHHLRISASICWSSHLLRQRPRQSSSPSRPFVVYEPRASSPPHHRSSSAPTRSNHTHCLLLGHLKPSSSSRRRRPTHR
jgi:hypothetical protein